MVVPRRYPVGFRERAARLVIEARKDSETCTGAVKRIGDQLGVHPEVLRTWVKQAETGEGLRPGTTTVDAARVVELGKEVRELRRARAILKSVSAFFAGELDRPSR